MNDYGYNEGIEFYGLVPKVMEATSIKTIGENELEVIDFQETAWGNAVDPEPEPEPGQHEYVDLGLPSKTLWAKHNIQDADGNELYFAWGETSGYTSGQVGTDKYFSWTGDSADYKYGIFDFEADPNYGMTKYNSADGKTELVSEDDAATANWGSDWKMPTKEQFDELISSANTTSAFTEQNGVSGLLLTSKANNNTLFFPAVGRVADGEVGNVGDYGYYWSVSLYDDDVYFAWLLYFLGENCVVDYLYRCFGYSVRPVRSNN